MPYENIEVDDSESDHDYDDVFASDEDESNFRNSRVSRSKSLEDSTSFKPKPNESNGRVSNAVTEKRSQGLFGNSSAKTNIKSFLRKSKERVPSLSSKSPGEAVLVSVGTLPDTDLVDSIAAKFETQKISEPEYAPVTNKEPLLTKRKFLITKSLTNSPQLLHKSNQKLNATNNNNDDEIKYLTNPDIVKGISQLRKSQRDLTHNGEYTRDHGRGDRIYENISRNGGHDREFDEVDFRNKSRSPHDTLQENFPQVLFRRGTQHEESPMCIKGRVDYQSSGLQSFPDATISLKDAETQTHETPSISRSSSCTWNSECSSSLFNTGSTNASASDDETAAVDDDIRSSSSSGLEVGGAGEPGEAGGEESGIGTASPPLKQRKENFEKTPNKCKRKETWERLRRRQSQYTRHQQYIRASTGNDVWVRRESVMTQTVDPDELDAAASDHTCNTEDTSSNENLLLDESANEASANETSISENSLRRNILSRKINAGNSPMNFPSSNSPTVTNEDINDSGLNSSESSIPNSCAKSGSNSKPIRPTCLQLKIVNIPPLAAMDSQSSSGDCLDDVMECREFFGQFAGREQPSPSSASLKLSLAPMPSDLGGKCASVPALLRRRVPEKGSLRRGDGQNSEDNMPHKLRAQSEKQLLEIEAAEACKWLRAAGFPQYAQMYEDMQFPINVSGVQSDHPFLDPDSLQSLFRRLAALNKCADMKVEHQHTPKHTHEDSDEENQCALSENWQYERKSRRWSRVVDINPQAQQRLQAIADRAIAEQNARDRAEGIEPAQDLLTVPGQEAEGLDGGRGAAGDDQQGSRFRRTGSERLRDGAKALLRRVESIKSRKKRRQNRDGVVISSPVFDVMTIQQKMKDLNCVDISPTANLSFIDFPSSPTNYPSSPVRSHPPSPLATMPPSPMTSTAPTFIGQQKLSPSPFGEDSSSYCSDVSQGSGHRPSARVKLGNRAKKFLQRNMRSDDTGAMSDSECQPSSWRQHLYFKDANSNDTKVVYVEPPSPPEAPSETNKPSSPPSSPIAPASRSRSRSPSHRGNARTGSLNLGKEPHRYRDRSFKRDKSASRNELSGSQDSGGSQHSHDEAEDKVQSEVSPRHKGNVQRWHSFQRSSSLGSRPTSTPVVPNPAPQHEGDEMGVRPMAAMSCGQLQVLRKLALLKLTACMERYCPTHRTGWNWELPKFIRKIKAPDYKDKTVFGVPLLVSLQRTGHALPKPIQTALRWLRNNALDQVGIFRKAGVRSRTLRLRQLAESAGTTSVGGGHSSATPPPPPATLAPYDEQQAHDVADMVKQYFRELPDALLTNKLSETFIAIFQHVPQPMREDAVQCALLLLPEEHREALQVVLAFLQQVADHSATNQMTASNLAVCLAPTLLRLHHHQQGQGNSNKEGNSNRSASASPRRRRGGTAGNSAVAAPDARELNESKAAHDCLLLLIKRHRELFTVSADTLQRCKFNSLEESIPVTLEELGSEFQQDWKGFQEASTQALLKEAREKSRGWVSVSTHEPHVDLCYRKVGDGHPLRLWRVTTEVEAPPSEVLNRILRERHIWDDSLLKWRVVERLNGQAEVFQYLTASMAPLQAKDYCVLRSWQSDLPRGGCCVVETSVSHAGAPVLLGGVRAVVLASRYLIEPAGKGRSRLMHLARVDTKGRTPEWYNKSYGHLCALYSARIRASFKHNTDGPESNV